ncbi:hypothetical protein PoB_002710200 [Plakobranchus ocellatus]|uniref:Uncharacterized protein n=1 Tax=Plakobranchus ocellatus TaxID=259542 RepID=A0AAV4A157_9GAST|nr:hypothetical protein PoB_002710200 [Plakobranchus ocellatus]
MNRTERYRDAHTEHKYKDGQYKSHNKLTSGFHAHCQARAPLVGLEFATDRSLHISGRIRYPLCHRRPSMRLRSLSKAGFFLYIASPQQGDLRHSGPPSGQGSNPRQKGPCRSQGGLASHCATDAPFE